MADTKIKPWSERVGKMPGAPDGVIRFAMLEEIDELRAALASRPAEVDGSPVDQACARVHFAEAELKAARKALVDAMTTVGRTNG
jgi:hypothetical protein